MKADIAIIGAGFAGASTAFHLALNHFPGRIVILEKEEIPGFHASGRNASLVLESVGNPEIRRFAALSVREYLARREDVGYSPVGSLQLGNPAQLDGLRDTKLIPSQLMSRAEAVERVSLLREHQFDSALLTPSDGVMEISRLLHFYLDGARTAGVELHLNCPVAAIRDSGTGFRIETPNGEFEASTIVNGAGAWAPEIGHLAGAARLPMRSFKRHLFVLDGAPELDPNWPFTWSVDRNFYFRPESGGLLFSICDEEPCDQGFHQTVSPDINERLAELIGLELPGLSDCVQRRTWSCFRTKTPDGLFHLGWDSLRPGFFWVAGLGGHGMGASWEIGRRAAAAILERLLPAA